MLAHLKAQGRQPALPLAAIAMEARMRTLRSAAGFGLVPISLKTCSQSRDCIRAMRETRASLRRMLSCRPIIKRMATRDELARICEELEAAGTCNLGARSFRRAPSK
jgi:hypothetical protein